MGGGSRPRSVLLLGFSLALFFGVAIYLRIWAIQSSFTIDDREALRKQFDRANMEAMDESAEWRMKYDGELQKSRQYQEEIAKVKDALSSSNEKLGAVQEENHSLQRQVETLYQKLKVMEKHCSCN